ncbi:MAG: VCBS repeat-containing protein, partial [Planctomycetaceae bacterium]
TVQVADINGDGRPDVVLSPSELAGNSYRLSWFEAPDNPRQASWTEHIIADPIECVIHGLATGDFNGDGAVDVAISEMHQGKDPDEVVIFISRNAGIDWQKQVLSTKGSHYIRAGDIGSDGDMDLVGANWSGPYQLVELWENTSATHGPSR